MRFTITYESEYKVLHGFTYSNNFLLQTNMQNIRNWREVEWTQLSFPIHVITHGLLTVLVSLSKTRLKWQSMTASKVKYYQYIQLITLTATEFRYTVTQIHSYWIISITALPDFLHYCNYYITFILKLLTELQVLYYCTLFLFYHGYWLTTLSL